MPELISNQSLAVLHDPVQEISKNRLERRNRLIRGPYQSKLSKSPTTKMGSKFCSEYRNNIW